MAEPTELPSVRPEQWRPSEFEERTPSVARMYDYLLGGKDNLGVDRERAREAVGADPLFPRVVRENRAFLGRVARFLAEERGIDQFLDIGTGLPTNDNVHQIVQRINPDASVVYVDNDPVVLAHGRALLADNQRTTVIQADLRDPGAILAHPDVRRLLDLDRPVALLLLAILHFVPDAAEPHAILDELRDALPSGSYLAITHGSPDLRPDVVHRLEEIYSRTASPALARSHEDVLRFFGDFEMIDPGLVWVPWWRPEEEPADDSDLVWFLGGVGRKP
ncbi:SAM-dependent methyltransferase [Actinomadura harenae]|uniref:SAM-dependent methyltransferase n=1 Tax=Actinomadura harenae TaxID=2483351 RepID=A0A3M2MBB4_9ACTN|nr:SAM-dependent methyltransferase [Actinomadura harenae]RMI46290.1 SAM-dependent methyltransferase [Actinomadura harenae]